MYASSSSSSMEMEEGTVSVSPAICLAEKSSAPPPTADVVAADSAPNHHPQEEASAAEQGDQDSSSTDQPPGADSGHMVVKGKRTKRPRTSPPAHPYQTPAASSTSNSYLSGGSSGVTEEEEDMANCLILLAQGDPHAVGAPDAVNNNDDKHHEDKGSGSHGRAISSRKFAETSVSAAGCTVKAGFYVYECKTCSKCFPTFQALGGHRASHKKLKMGGVEPSSFCAAGHTDSEEKTRPLEQVLMHHNHKTPQEAGQPSVILDSPPTPIMPPAATMGSILHHHNNMATLINHSSIGIRSTTARVHECSICGSEFQSGQALGGHMRRHRAASTAVAASSTVMPGSPSQLSDNQPPPKNAEVVKTTKTVVLSLDLNLPAPSDDADFPTQTPSPPPAFPFSAPSKRSPMLFSASPLVDCHY